MLKSLTLACFLFLSSIYSCGQSHTAATEEDPNIFLSTNQFQVGAELGPVTFNNLPVTPGAGTVIYVSNGTPGSPCTGGGSGALAVYSGGAWVCLPNTGGGGSSLTVETNGTNNSSQSILNFTSTTSLTGITFSNPSGGVESATLAANIVGTDSGLLSGSISGGTLGQNFCVDSNGGATANPAVCTNGGGSLTGGGTAGKLAEWTGTASLGNSPITDNGSTQLSVASGYSLFMTNTQTATQNPAIHITSTANNTSSIANVYGVEDYAAWEPFISFGTATATNVYGQLTQAYNLGAAGGTSDITNLYGQQIFAFGGATLGYTANQYGLQITSQSPGSTGVNKGLDVLTGDSGTSTTGNDYGIFIEPMPNTCAASCGGTHYGMYVADQGAQNYTNTSWAGIYIAAQTIGPGFNRPTYGIYVAGNTPNYFEGGIQSAASAFAALTDAATVTWAIGSNQFANTSLTFTVHSGSRTLNITNPVSGGQYQLILTQDATGGEGLTLGSGCTWKVLNGGGGTVTLTGTPNAVDILTFTYNGLNSTCIASIGHNAT